MKKIILIITLAIAVALSGCNLMQQSNQTHKAIEAKNIDVHQVVVAVENGVKTVTVYVIDDVNENQKKKIRKTVKKNIPDTREVKIRPASEAPPKKTK